MDLGDEQATWTIDALTALRMHPRVPVNPQDFAVPSVREEWVRVRGMQVFSMYDPSNPMRVVDLFVDHPIPFEELWSRSEEVDLQNVTVHIASIPDLMPGRAATGSRRHRAAREDPAGKARRWERTDHRNSLDRWDATWEGARRHHLESTLAATPAQRLAWLEEALELASRSGALARTPAHPGA